MNSVMLGGFGLQGDKPVMKQVDTPQPSSQEKAKETLQSSASDSKPAAAAAATKCNITVLPLINRNILWLHVFSLCVGSYLRLERPSRHSAAVDRQQPASGNQTSGGHRLCVRSRICQSLLTQTVFFNHFHALRHGRCLCRSSSVVSCRVSRSYRPSVTAQVLLESSFEVSRCVHAMHGMYYEGQPLHVRKVGIVPLNALNSCLECDVVNFALTGDCVRQRDVQSLSNSDADLLRFRKLQETRCLGLSVYIRSSFPKHFQILPVLNIPVVRHTLQIVYIFSIFIRYSVQSDKIQ